MAMNKKEIMEAIKSLASCQGRYARLYEYIKENGDGGALLNYLAMQNFKDKVDMVMFIEGGY